MRFFRIKYLKAAIAAILLTSCVEVANAQVGIGTTTPDTSAALDIVSTGDNTGVLFPRLTTAQRDAIASPATGLLIFNVSTNTFNYNFGTPGTPNWVSLAASSVETRSIKSNIVDTSTDLSGPIGTQISVPLFDLFGGTPLWNDDPGLFNVTSASTLEITEAGRYEISGTLFLMGNLSAQVASAIYVNGTQVGAPYASGEGLFSANILSSITFIETLELSANDVLSLRTESITFDGQVFMATMNGTGSFFQVKKLN